MNSKALHSVKVVIKNAIKISLSVALVAATHAQGQKSDWKTVDQMSAEDKALFDPNHATPRDASIPYIPAEKFPFKAPYTAEEMGYRSAQFSHISRWSHSISDVFGVVTSSGYVNQGEWACFVDFSQPGIEGYINSPVGQELGRWMLYETFPPESEGAQQLWIPIRSDKVEKKRLEFFYYSPSMRRVRRMPEPRRDQRFANNAQTLDDVMGRDPWEFQWELLGTDVLYETARFPATRSSITWNEPGKGFVERPVSSIKLMGDDFDHYTSDGGVETWVLKATTKEDWLPDYNEKYLIVWVEKHTFFILRREKYGHDGRLITIESRMSEKENPALGDLGYTSKMGTYWNIDHDLISYSFHDAHQPRVWSDEQKNMIFKAEFMPREWLFEPIPSQLRLDSPDEFFLRPHLYPDKFPNHRNTTLPPDVQSRYQQQEIAKKLVFETE
jgi:hypothetical protein